MKIAVDTIIGNRGIAKLREAGHEVVVVADPGEQDRAWFARARAVGVEVVIAADTDVEILCYDANVTFFRVRQCERGHEAVQRFINKRPKRKSQR